MCTLVHALVLVVEDEVVRVVERSEVVLGRFCACNCHSSLVHMMHPVGLSAGWVKHTCNDMAVYGTSVNIWDNVCIWL